MSSIRIGFVGDPHLGRAARWTGPEGALALHRRDVLQQLHWCQRRGCTHVVWLGDTFDTPSPTQEYLALGHWLFDQCRLPSALLAGNHEVRDDRSHALRCASELPPLGALRHVQFAIRPTTASWDGWQVLLVPWGHAIDPSGNRPDAVAFHEAVQGARMDNGHPSRRGLRHVTDMGVPAVGGHLHVPQGRALVRFAGTSTQKSFGEPPRKRMLHLTLRRGRDPMWHSEEVRDPAWILRRVNYCDQDPPRCDHPRTFYSVGVSQCAPPPRWMTGHPRVVTTHGSNPDRALRAASRIVNAMEGESARGTDDRELLGRWLRQHASLDDLMRANALRLHDRLSSGTT